MLNTQRIFLLVSILTLLTSAAWAQEPTPLFKKRTTATSGTLSGSGTPGRLSKWAGVGGTSTFVLGDSNIFEDKFGKVGIGTTNPTSLLTIAGMIEITLGGLKFPDGSVQTTAGLASVFHDATLRGNGTQASPLGVAVPLNLTGASTFVPVLTVQNTFARGTGVSASGGDINISGGLGGDGVVTRGGNGDAILGFGGRGVVARGGNGGAGGVGVSAEGGDGSAQGGVGVSASGGSSDGGNGGNGVFASGGGQTGVGSSSNGGNGVLAFGGSGRGTGKSSGNGIEAFSGEGIDGATSGLAGKFNGNVQVTGTLAKGGGSFKIDHPLDPENKYLYHSFVESPDMMNIYNGNIITDGNGEATVTLPDYFEALNKDFRYQLTVVGQFAQAIVAEKVKGNRFVIQTSAPNVEVSWQVTGIRRDAFANRNRIPVEEAKPERERGHYLHPEAFDQPEEKSIEWARNPERMRQLKERRLESERTLRPKANQR